MAHFNLLGDQPHARRVDSPHPIAHPNSGLAEGTIIYTLDGALPVEFLSPGDRVITRTGAQQLSSVEIQPAGFLLHFSSPQVFYADGVETLAA